MNNCQRKIINLYSASGMQTQITLLLLFLGIFLTPYKSMATIYDFSDLYFETSGQSMWNTGTTYQFDETVFLGSEWKNKTVTVGGITGGRSNVCVPYLGCTVADTRTGIKARMTTSAKVGFEFGVKIDSGSVNAAVSYAADLFVPESGKLSPGEFVQLNTNSDFFGRQRLNTIFPTTTLSASMVLGAKADFFIKGCVISLGCKKSSSGEIGFDPYTQELVTLNKNGEGGVELLGGAVKASTLAKLVSLASGDIPTIAPTDPSAPNQPGVGEIIVDIENGFPVDIDIPADGGGLTSSRLGNITLYLPQPDTSGGLDQSTGSLKSSGQDDFIDLSVDVDNVISTFGYESPGAMGGTVNIPAIGTVDYDLINVELGSKIDLRQEFELTPTLMVDLVFDNPVMVAGVGMVTEIKNQVWDELAEIAFFTGKTTVTPEFWLNATLTNKTLFDVDINMLLDLLSANIDYTFFGKSGKIEMGIGNVFDGTFNLFDPTIYNKSFSLAGFNRIYGESFTVTVPEPGTLLLISIGLLGMHFYNRKKKNVS